MREIVELSSLDLRYEGHRLRDDAREARLLASIAERGIEEPLQGVDTSAARFLLDGFKRCRSAKKLGIDCVPYVSLGEEEATGILNLMRASTGKGLGILEQARFVVDLVSIHGMSVAEVAQTLSRSKGWVSMRRRLLDEMSPAIREILFRGAFPVYSYMYTLRPFMRMNAPATAGDRAVRPGRGRPAAERAGHRAVGPGILPRPGFAAGGDRGGQAGLVARSVEARAGGSGRLQRGRAWAAEGSRTPAEVHAAGDGQVPRPAAGQPGLLGPSELAERRSAEHVGDLFAKG